MYNYQATEDKYGKWKDDMAQNGSITSIHQEQKTLSQINAASEEQ